MSKILFSGTLESPTVCNTTIISAFYHIKSKHSYEDYLMWMINFLSLTDCMVIFTQPDMVSTIKSMRGSKKSSKSVIIPRSIQSFMMFHLLNKKQWEEQELMDPDHYPGHTKELFMIWNEKTNMMKLAADINPFSSTYFVWLDIGAVRHPKYNEEQLVKRIPHDYGVLLLNVDHFTENELHGVADFSHVDRIGGTTIGCDKESLNQWHKAYYGVIGDYLDKGWFIGKDQNMMATTCVQTELCLLLPGDTNHWFKMQEWFRGESNEKYVRMKQKIRLKSNR